MISMKIPIVLLTKINKLSKLEATQRNSKDDLHKTFLLSITGLIELCGTLNIQSFYNFSFLQRT